MAENVTPLGALQARHILLVMPALLPESIGGAERQCQILTAELVKAGWSVTVLAPSCDRTQPPVTELEGVRIYRLFFRHYPNFGGKYLFSFLSWTARALLWIAGRRTGIDAIYVFHARLHVAPAALAALLFRMPLFIKLGRGGKTFDFESLREKKFLYGKAVLHLVKRATTAFVANSSEIGQNLRDAGIRPNRILAIPNGVQMPEQSVVDTAERKRTSRVFLYAGRLALEKNVDLLVQAFALAARDVPGSTLRLAGDGPLAEELQALAAKLCPDSESIVFLGPVAGITREYLAADFFISASGAEGQSNALLEAMGCAAMPIVYGASGAFELVQDGETGLLIPDLSVPSIRETIVRAASLGPMRATLAAQARRKVLADFSIAQVAKATGKSIRGALK